MSRAQIQSRRIALWALYAVDVGAGVDAEDLLIDAYATLEEIVDELPELWPDIERRVFGVAEHAESLNATIQRASPRWRLERMATIDRNILRLGVWEILHGATLPVIVIDACVELAKEYGEKGSPSFVNGLLDQICRNEGVAISEPS